MLLGPKVTWYLSTYQFGYLTFARDLLHGQVFHRWPPAEALAAFLPAKTDVLTQTYVYDRGVLWCRYPPGFPLLLAGWMAVFGSEAVHYLNLTLFLVLLAVIVALAWRLLDHRWGALIAVTLIVLCPSYVDLWALTPLPDVTAHLAALLGLLLLLPSRGGPARPVRAALAGAALGFAITARYDAGLYLVPAMLVIAFEWPRAPRRTVTAVAVGLLLGLGPLLLYNWKVSGNPLWPTQGMEIEDVLGSLPAARPGSVSGWHGGTTTQVQGGGLKLRNLPGVLPGYLRLISQVYGPVLLGLAVWGTVLATIVRPVLLRTVVPYVILALAFFSCWSRPNSRFLAGLHFLIPVLIVEGLVGTVELSRRLLTHHRPAARSLPILVGAALFIATTLFPGAAPWSPLPNVTRLVGWGGAALLLVTGLWPGRRLGAILIPLLAGALVALTGNRVRTDSHGAGFQGPAVQRSRATVDRQIAPGGVVITTEDVGRPAENIEYYSAGVGALYLTDLERWRIPVPVAAEQLLTHGVSTYLLLPPAAATRIVEQLRSPPFRVEPIADVAPSEAIDYFVAASFHRGVRLTLLRITRD